MKKISKNWISRLAITGMLLMLVSNCKKDNNEQIPVLSTVEISEIKSTTSTSGGNITSDGGAAITGRGVCWSTNHNPTISNERTEDGSEAGSFTSNITGLTAGTTYFVRAYANNSVGTAYGNEISFTTLSTPILSTSTVTEILLTTATSGGSVSSDGGAAVTGRGVCWSINHNPTISNERTEDGSGTGSFTSNITGLTQSSLYYVRAYATNSIGTAYGNEITFKASTAIDIDGNLYNIIGIGDQIWMKENLKTTKYSDGTLIPNITNDLEWKNLSSGAYSWYNQDISYKNDYGALYNSYAVLDSRKLCPSGWHVPTDAELTILTDYLNGETIAGGKLKEAGTTHWLSPNTGAENSSNFLALPGSNRDYNGTFANIGKVGYWWSSSQADIYTLWGRSMYYNNSSIYRAPFDKNFGFSVRCIKD